MTTSDIARNVTIRNASAQDISAVEVLLRAAQLTTDGVARLIDNFIVAEASGEIVGVAGLECCDDNALLRSVAVDPAWRSRGLGRVLVSRIIAEAESRGIPALYLLTTSAESYYPPFGFHTIARDEAPSDIRNTSEFSGACPDSAALMVRACASR